MRKILFSFILVLVILLVSQPIYAEYDIFSDNNLKEINTAPGTFDTTSGIGGAINTIIGLLQVAGTGISLITVTFLGIKYVMAGVGEKAEIKKQATPIVIGCILLFGAVNIMAIVEKFAGDAFNK